MEKIKVFVDKPKHFYFPLILAGKLSEFCWS